ncbi:alpha/beta hydrolase [Telluria mixta]|uniref:Alpha/beta hydrolase n=1 Tax=Telluria mixta TaxID=34071 RepID=A0ABT2C5X7_9BURK|nr:alpha/beta hydrolase [Telluria mixta]MCS0632221.1 alpha/beta hydrolase [Telluria mixta]WEM95016.1 alpha/beta hydrolase [Telluria mixta]
MHKASPAGHPECIDIAWDGRTLQLELARVGAPGSPYPPVIFLHEGLGSVAQWKDFPERFCRTHGFTGMAYSRYGYGRSTPRPHAERWGPDYLHRQAWEVLPALIDALGLRKPWLFGHSDGASIALLAAARLGDRLGGIVVAAPHIMVEDVSIRAIRAAREAYLAGPLRERLAHYHADVDSAFWAWNDSWLDPAFRSWDIRAEVARIRIPLMAIQGEDDEYGTMEQVEGIARLAPQTRLLVLPGCGHTPHRDAAGSVIGEAGRFIIEHSIII